MTADEIRIYGDPVLRKKADPVVIFDDELKETAEGMYMAMLEADGIGLAAPQVNISKAFLVIGMPKEDDEIERLFFANPEMLETGGETSYKEGCLSVPEISEEILRPEWIKLKYQDIEGNEQILETDGLLARVLQHEIDHLNGILFVDRVSPIRKALLKRALKKLAESNGEERPRKKHNLLDQF
ncbi:MAG: peptide deformylase [bacterium]|nr:peptide deformylase [bacterium]